MMRSTSFRQSNHVLDTLTLSHRRIGIIPSSDASLRYIMPIPRGWGRVCGLAASPAVGRSEILGLFAPEPDLTGPRIIVATSRLRWDVDPIQWVRHHWERAGWSIVMARPLDARWHPRFEVGGVRRTEGKVEVRRSTGFVDNGRLVRVDVAAPRSRWAAVHDLLWPCGVLFSLARPTFRREVEVQDRIGIGLVAFGLPASWKGTVARAAWVGAHRFVAAPGDGAEGSAALRVDVTPWSRQGIELIAQRQHRMRHELRMQGISLARHIERIPAGLASGVSGLVGVFRAAALDHEEGFEVRLAHREVDGLSVDYTMIVASPERHPLDLMRASRALEIAVATTEARPVEATHAA